MSPMSENLIARLERMEAIEVARGMVAQYAECIDAVALVELRALFADAMVLTMPGRRYEGADAVIEFYRARLGADTRVGRHFVTNTRVEHATADEVTLASVFLFTTAGSGQSELGWGRYRDTFGRTAGELRFTGKQITVEYRGPIEAAWGRRTEEG